MDSSNGWADIQNLALLLKEAQMQKLNDNLPERHCVDLINLLIENNYISLIHTTDGKEYLTKKRLTQEVIDAVKKNGGRMSFLKLQQTINVDYSHIEKCTRDKINESSAWQILNDDVITDTYIDSIIQETQDILNQKGIVSYNEICEKFSIPIDFMKKIFKYHEGELFTGDPSTVRGGSFVSSQYILRVEATLRGSLLAHTLPIQIHHFAKKLDHSEEFIITNITQLINSKQISGVICGSIFFPGDTLVEMTDFLEQEFIHKKYINHTLIYDYGFTEPISLIKYLFKERKCYKITHLDSISIISDLIDEISAKISSILNSAEILNLHEIFDADITKIDRLTIFDLCLKKLKLPLDFSISGLIHFEDQDVLLSNKLVTLFKEDMIRLSQERSRNLLVKDENFRNDLQALKQTTKRDISELEDFRGKRKDWKSKQSNPNNNLNGLIKSHFNINSFDDHFQHRYPEINHEIITKIIECAYSEFCKNVPIAILHTLEEYYSQLQSSANTEMVHENSQASKNMKNFQNNDIKNLESKMKYIYNLILLYESDSSKIGDSELSVDIGQYILSSFGFEIFDLLLKIYICHNFKGLEITSDDLTLCSSIETFDSKKRDMFLQLINEDSHSNCFKKLYDAIRSKEKAKFHSAILALSEKSICNISLKTSLNSSTLKSTKRIHLETLLSQCNEFKCITNPSVEDYAKIFNICLSIYVTYHSGYCILFPGKRISSIINYLDTFNDFTGKDICTEIKTQIIVFIKQKKMNECIERDDVRVRDVENLVKASVDILGNMLK